MIDPRTREGELLWPARFGHAAIADLKRTLGSYGWAGQYQQRPSPAEGGRLKRKWWKTWSVMPASWDLVIESWDCAFKKTDESSYVVGQVWGKKGSEIFLLDQVRERLDFPDTCKAIENLSVRWPMAGAKLVEEKANGAAVISYLQKTVSGLLPRDADVSKETRVAAASPFVEAGNVYLPHQHVAPWVTDFIEECAAFPKGVNDDQVDAFTQAVKYLLIDGVGTPWGYQSAGRPAPRTGAYG